MPETWIILVVLMSMVNAFIIGGSALRHLRVWRRRRALLRGFLIGIAEHELRATRRRRKHPFAAGFIDTYHGISGARPFRLHVRIEPWKAHTVSLGLYVSDATPGERSFEHWQFVRLPNSRMDELECAYESVRAVASGFKKVHEAS
jgi:hypothetical protein